MSKLGCTCGYTIKDNTDHLPYKAGYYSDEDTDAYEEAITALAAILQASERVAKDPHQRSEQQKFRALPLEMQIVRILSSYHIGYRHDLYECEHCGRLWVGPSPRENTFVSYLPESNTRGILRSHGGREEQTKALSDRLKIMLSED